LENNQLSGSIPESLGDLKQLKNLYVKKKKIKKFIIKKKKYLKKKKKAIIFNKG